MYYEAFSRVSFGNSVICMNDGTSPKSIRQIRRTDNLRSIIWVTQLNQIFNLAVLVKYHK